MISVVVVTYKRLDYLKITIESILNQSYSDIEIIIVGDGHQQDVADYIEGSNDKRMRYYYTEHCGYPAKARNLGIEMANGEYIAFCDDDDIWYKNKLQKQIEVMSADDTLMLCCTNRSVIDENGVVMKTKALRYPISLHLWYLLLSNYVSFSSVLLRKEILKQTGVFPDDIKLKALEDYHLWLRIIYQSKAFFIDESLIGYRVHTNNITTKFASGAKRSISMFRDVFTYIHVRPMLRFLAISVARLKYLYYSIAGK